MVYKFNINTRICLCTLILCLSLSGRFCTWAQSLNSDTNCMKDSQLVYDHTGRFKLYRNFSGVSLFSCAAECRVSKVCKSFNFNTSSFTCELSGKGPQPLTDLLKVPGMIFSNKKSWSGIKTLDGSCAHHECPDDTHCMIGSMGMPVCSEEYEDCGPPIPHDDADMDLTGTDVGSVLKLLCKEGCFFCGESHVATCTPRGSWEGLDGKCVNGTVETDPQNQEPDTNSYRLPCFLTEGKTLEINMTVEQSGFAIALIGSNGTNHMLQIKRTGRLEPVEVVFKDGLRGTTPEIEPTKLRIEVKNKLKLSIHEEKSTIYVQLGTTLVLSFPDPRRQTTDALNTLITEGVHLDQVKMSAKP